MSSLVRQAVAAMPRGGPRLSRWIGRKQVEPGTIALTGPMRGVRMRFNTTDPNQARMAFGTYQTEVMSALRKLARRGDRVLVAGANIGYVPLALAKLGCEVFAFEADPRNVEASKLNFGLNPQLPITFFDFGLSDEQATIPMWQSDFGALSSFGAKHYATHSVDVSVKRGDDVLTEPVDGLLLDVEGWEVQALKGLRKTLSQVRWAIIECAPWALEAAGTTEAELRFMITELRLHITTNLSGDLVCSKAP